MIEFDLSVHIMTAVHQIRDELSRNTLKISNVESEQDSGRVLS